MPRANIWCNRFFRLPLQLFLRNNGSDMNIVICGNYGATNLGDEAILEGILSLVRRSLAETNITVLSANPEETTALHGLQSLPLVPAGVRSLIQGFVSGSLWKTLKAIKRADLFLLGGGGLFTDEKMRAVVIWALQTWVARRYKTPIFSFGQSVGPLNRFFGRRIAAKAFQRAHIITVRDAASADLVKRLGIDDVYALADPAFALPSTEPTDSAVEPYVVVSVRPWIEGDTRQIHADLAAFIDWLWKEHNLKTVLVPFQISHDNDVAELSAIQEMVKKPEAVELFDYTPDYHEVMELMARSTAVVGMRLHSLIFSSLSHTPFVGLSYSEKVRNFARQIQMDEYVLDWTSASLDELKQRFEGLLEHREELVAKLDEQVMVQRAHTLQHEELLRDLSN